METALIAGATIIIKGLADITIDQLKTYIKRKQEQNLEGKTR